MTAVQFVLSASVHGECVTSLLEQPKFEFPLTFTGTHKSLWDAVLNSVKVVVSTYQILLDALTHAFVHIESLALIVFDEGE
jgi:hypothetical protein